MALRFVTHLLAWTAALVAAQVLAGLLGGGALGGGQVAAWTGLALVFAAYPAGLAASEEALVDERPGRVAARLATLGLALGASTLVAVGWLAPWLAGSAFPAGDPGRMDLVALYGEARLAVQAAEAAPGPPTVASWLPANALAWSFASRIAAVVLTVTLAWLGVLVGRWSRRVRQPELRQLQQWVVGLCLVVSTYLAGENAWELVVLKAAGPAYPLAWLRVVAPGVLLCGLAWVTIVDVLGHTSRQPE